MFIMTVDYSNNGAWAGLISFFRWVMFNYFIELTILKLKNKKNYFNEVSHVCPGGQAIVKMGSIV